MQSGSIFSSVRRAGRESEEVRGRRGVLTFNVIPGGESSRRCIREFDQLFVPEGIKKEK